MPVTVFPLFLWLFAAFTRPFLVKDVDVHTPFFHGLFCCSGVLIRTSFATHFLAWRRSSDVVLTEYVASPVPFSIDFFAPPFFRLLWSTRHRFSINTIFQLCLEVRLCTALVPSDPLPDAAYLLLLPINFNAHLVWNFLPHPHGRASISLCLPLSQEPVKTFA